MSPYTRENDNDHEEAIDIGPSNAFDISRIARQIDAKLNKQVGRMIKRDPDRSVSVIRRWLSES